MIIGASLDAANELARKVAEEKGAAFGWHRVTLPQLAAALAAPLLAERKLVPISRLGAEAIVARVVHRLKAEAGLGRYQPVGETPGFARAIAAVIAELRLASLTSGAIGKVAPDLMRLMEAYEASLAEADLTDWPGVLKPRNGDGERPRRCPPPDEPAHAVIGCIYQERSRACILARAQRCSPGHLSYGTRRRPANPRTHPRRPALEI